MKLCRTCRCLMLPIGCWFTFDLQQYPALSCMMMAHQRTSKQWKIMVWRPRSQQRLAGTCHYPRDIDEGSLDSMEMDSKPKKDSIYLGNPLVWVCCELNQENVNWKVVFGSRTRLDLRRGCSCLGLSN